MCGILVGVEDAVKSNDVICYLINNNIREKVHLHLANRHFEIGNALRIS